MAKNDRCEICDYSEHFGSSYLNIPPNKNGRVYSRPNGDGAFVFLCDTCFAESYELREPSKPVADEPNPDLPILDTEFDNDAPEDAPTVSVREEF